MAKARTKQAMPAPVVPPAPAPGQRNPALETAILAAPDEVAGYLVYGDWLQERGDPRGTLIALMHALDVDPDDAGAKAAMAELLREHDHTFLGLVGRYRDEIELAWALGFWHRAVLRFATRAKLEDALEALLRHPSACFLQELVIAPLAKSTERIDVHLIETILVHTPHPPLRRLAVGAVGEWPIPEAIHALFPRLRQDDAAVWAAAMDKLAAERALKTPFDAMSLPALAQRDAWVKLAVDPKAIVVGLRMELDKGRDLGLVAAMRQVFTTESLDRFALALVTRWFDAGERGQDRWAFDVTGVLGGEHSAAYLGGRLAELSHQRCVQALEHLARIGSPAAMSEIIGLSIMPSRFQPRRAWADENVLGAGDARHQRLVETCPRSVLPEAHDRLIATQRRWLFDLMIHGRRIGVTDFERHVAHHAIRGPLAAGLLWTVRASKSDAPVDFRLDATRRNLAVDFHGALVVLPASHLVGLVHPIELAEPALLAWQRVFDAIDAPFDQLWRPLYRLGERGAEAEGELVSKRFAAYRVGFQRIREGLERADWLAFVDHGVEAFYRYFDRGDVTLVATLPGNTGAIQEVWAQQGRSDGPSERGRIPLARVHPVVISEAFHDIARAVGEFREAPPARPVAQPIEPAAATATGLVQQGRYPFAELAKSSRSTCVICELKIEKQTVRIGVERVIETPAFTGRATAWLHAACRDRCPELAALPDLDARLTANSAGVWPPR